MKWIIGLLLGAFIGISAGMVYLTQKGVSIRTAPQIKPTAILNEQLPQQLAENLLLRLFPELQQTDYWWLGIPQNQAKLLDSFFATIETQMKSKLSRIEAYGLSSTELETALLTCQKPCWILMDPDKASELSGNTLSTDPRFQKSQTLTYLSFQRGLQAREQCLTEKRISYGCLLEIALNEIKPKLKVEKPFLFMRKYLDRDYFLMVEDPT